ncbi:hypothetical protein K461DRAFT_264820 [Myriangium duriaei CBS 260.36]|uniref:F-box domain-containing protein n=1 Tax=Myriangium duriaei CBS 260.36 TaxID=1168546 RepID=A0A9P4MQ83_9PEZI|nr:hypothetical protein K461DRAFT_264820 [Myriangium duriaei CBS 260.36]
MNASATTYGRSKPLSLEDMPTEILEQIASHLCGYPDSTIYIKRRTGTEFHQTDLYNGQVRQAWTVTGYPTALLLVNRRISEIVFSQLWRSTAFVLNLSSSDSLCFLKYALSDRQRAALRRIRLTRFMLSWEDPVGHDIWLTEHKREPAFYAKLASKLPNVPRVTNLVAHLQSRHPAVQALAEVSA